jgi:hypothetical protein
MFFIERSFTSAFVIINKPDIPSVKSGTVLGVAKDPLLNVGC